MSIRKVFEEELTALKAELAEMCRLTEKMISRAITALETSDRDLGASVALTDKRVDEYETDIEKKCMCILLTQQPVAKDFRDVSTAMKMITDIERFGDQASDIGEIVATMPGENCPIKSTHISDMGDLAEKMVRESVNSFIQNDEALANKVIVLDDRMDELFLLAKKELIEKIHENSEFGDVAIELMMIAKYLERIGDHAVNVAEWTKFNQTGVHLKF